MSAYSNEYNEYAQDNKESNMQNQVQNQQVPHIVTPGGITVFVDGRPFQVGKEDPIRFNLLKQAVQERQGVDRIRQLLDIQATVNAWVDDYDEVAIKDGVMYVENQPYPDMVMKKVMTMVKEGADAGPLVKHLQRLNANTRKSSREEGLLFEEANDMMIDEEGFTVTFKGVANNYYDRHSGTVFNKPADLLTQEERDRLPYTTAAGVTVKLETINGIERTVVEMPRHQVDDERRNACSYGLHVGAHSYANSWGDRTLVVRVDPADIVSVPYDAGNTKMRVSRYVILNEVERAQRPEYKAVYDSDRDFGYDDDYYEDDIYCDYCGEVGHYEDDCDVAADDYDNDWDDDDWF